MAGIPDDLDVDLDQVTEGIKKVDFHHPYTPYDVQEQFMRSVYDVLETGDGQVGILESPTGTGKSLSLICAALTWLRNHKQATFESSVEDAAKQFKDEPDWVVDMMLKRKKDEVIKKWEEREARLESVRAREKALEIRTTKRRRLNDRATGLDGDREPDEDEWLLDERDEDGSQGGESSNYSKDTRALMEKLGMMPKRDVEEEDGADQELKIYYTSRTHSQLTQFIEELRRPTFPPSIPEAMISKDNASEPEVVKHVPLSSRQRLCINPAVSRLGSVQAINDRCSELQQANSKSKCQFVPNPDKLAQTHQFRDHALAAIPDIEDMFELGKKLSICPYYASRTAIPGAEIITLPYPLLLQKTARDALGIKLEGNVVIIDEAHNIMDAVANVYASEISLSELRRARQMLGVYVKKFGKKLKGENRVMVAQVARVIDGLSDWLDGALKLKGDQGIVDSNNLLKSKGADQINLFKLIQYVQESKLAYKIEGYVAHSEQDPKNPSPRSSSSPVLHTLVSFLVSLTNLSTEGRIFYNKTPGKEQPDIKLSYLLLSPTHAFSSIASAARAVILAGGTMSPFDDYTAHLFPHLDLAKVTTLSCGHVVPPSSLCVWTLASARPGLDFEFSFSKRSDKRMIHELGVSILNICTTVPDGVVVFFPSYGYLEEVVAVWGGGTEPPKQHQQPRQHQNNTAPPSIWSRLQSKKAVFRESKGGSSDDVLAQYSEAILSNGSSSNPLKPASQQNKAGGGALLLSVVGGKMSEGINFSDRLGRCVIIVGLPYPNINSPDWKARIEYIETTTTSRLLAANDEHSGKPSISKPDATAKAKNAARDFYENACMRAVNQSIGRAIRHKGDYAAIVLLDRRFGADRIRRKLPGWIRAGMGEGSEGAGTLGQLMGKLNGFFREKKKKAQSHT